MTEHDKMSPMVATVSYEGIAIVKGAAAAEEGADGVFIECEAPMPVGTRVEVQLDRGGLRPARVVRVNETAAGTGMALAWTGEAGAAPPAPSPSAPPLSAPGGSDASGGAPQGATPVPGSGPNAGPGGGRRRRRR